MDYFANYVRLVQYSPKRFQKHNAELSKQSQEHEETTGYRGRVSVKKEILGNYVTFIRAPGRILRFVDCPKCYEKSKRI